MLTQACHLETSIEERKVTVEIQARNTPLGGLTVAITGSRRANELAHLVTRLGGTPYLVPTIAIQAPNKLKTGIRQFITEVLERRFDLILVITGPGIQAIIDESKKMDLGPQFLENLRQIPLVARSGKPQQVLSKNGIDGNVTMPSRETVEACFTLALTREVAAKRIAVIWHGAILHDQVDKLRATGAEVVDVSTYQYAREFDKSGTDLLRSLGYKLVEPDAEKIFQLIEDLGAGKVDVVTFTSPPAVANLFEIAAKRNRVEDLQLSLNNIITVAIGPATKQEIERHGIRVKVVPQIYKMGPMVAELAHYVEHSHLKYPDEGKNPSFLSKSGRSK
jgi:uroporphyrinogen-III synthase